MSLRKRKSRLSAFQMNRNGRCSKAFDDVLSNENSWRNLSIEGVQGKSSQSIVQSHVSINDSRRSQNDWQKYNTAKPFIENNILFSTFNNNINYFHMENAFKTKYLFRKMFLHNTTWSLSLMISNIETIEPLVLLEIGTETNERIKHARMRSCIVFYDRLQRPDKWILN